MRRRRESPWQARSGSSSVLAIFVGVVVVGLTGAASGSSARADVSCPAAQTAPGVSQDFVLSPPVANSDGSFTQLLTLGGVDRDLFALTSTNCWIVTNAGLQTLGTRGAVSLDGVVLAPVAGGSSIPTLTAEPSGSADGGAGVALSAFGADTEYHVDVPQADNSLVAIGRVDLLAQPFLYSNPGNDPTHEHVGDFGTSPDGLQVGGQQISGGSISLSGVQTVHVSAYVPLPSSFTIGPSTGGSVTGELDFDLGTPQGGGGGGSQGGGGGGFPPQPPDPCTQDPHAILPICPPPTKYLYGTRGLAGSERVQDLSQAIQLSVPDLWLGGLDIKNAFLDYDPSSGEWSGGGDLQLLNYSLVAAPPPPTLGFGFKSDGSFLYGGAELHGDAPIFPGVDLTELGVSFALHPTRFTGSATIQAGGVLTIGGTALVVFGDHDEPYTYQSGTLPGVDSLQATGAITGFAAGVSGSVELQVPVLGNVQLAHGYVFYIAPSYVEFAGGFNLSPLGFTELDGDVKGALDTGSGEYDLEGEISGCIDFPDPVGKQCAQLQGVLSSAGVGACGKLLGLGAYFRYEWHGGLTIDFGCDLGPIEVDVQPGATPRNGARRVTIPRHVPIASIIVKSATGTPRVAVRGPGGVALSGATGGLPVHRSGLAIMPLSGLHETVLGIEHPAAGTWTVTPLAGSPAITQVEHADGIPPAKISATVAPGSTGDVLTYHVRRRPGQTVTFAERAGGVFHVIGAATGATGTLPFTPVASHVVPRTIVALVDLSGAPRQTIVVGQYNASPPRAVKAPPGVKVARAGNALDISWGTAKGARSYLVVVTLADGRRLLLTPKGPGHRVVVPQVSAGLSASVQVMGVGADGVPGAAASGKLGGVALPAVVTDLAVARSGKQAFLHWHPTPGATAYLVRLTISHRGSQTLVAWKPSLPPSSALGALRHGHRVKIVVRALAGDGRIGPPQTIVYNPGQR